MNKLKVSLIPRDNDSKGYEPIISLSLGINTTIKDVKNFLKFYFNYHYNTSLEYKHLILDYSDDTSPY